jgi:MFS family permease
VRLLMGRDFRLLAISNGLSALGDELALIALTIKVFDLTGSGYAVSALLLAGIVPMVVFAPFAGLLVDRTETTGTLSVASLAQAGIALALAFADPLWLILALSFFLGTVASVASPAVFALVPRAVAEEDLTEANANLETASYLGMVAGPLIAGGLAAGSSTRTALIVDAVTFLVIASAAASLSVRRPPELTVGDRSKGEARQGFAFIRRDRVLLIAVAAFSLTVLFAVLDNVAEVFFAKSPDLLNAGDWGYGGLAAAWLLGMVAGATLIAGRLPDTNLLPSILLASLGGGTAVAVAALFPQIVLALVLFFIGGVANGVQRVSMRSLIHHRTPDRLRGRVFAAFSGLARAGQLGATALGGLLVAVSFIGPQRTLAISGIGVALVGVLGLLWFATLPGRAREIPEGTTITIPDAEPRPLETSKVEVRNITPVVEEPAAATREVMRVEDAPAATRDVVQVEDAPAATRDVVEVDEVPEHVQVLPSTDGSS